MQKSSFKQYPCQILGGRFQVSERGCTILTILRVVGLPERIQLLYNMTQLASFTNDTDFEVRVIIHGSMILKSLNIDVVGYYFLICTHAKGL